MELKYILKMFIIVFLIFSFILFFFNIFEKFIGYVPIEGLTNPPDTSILLNSSDAFCESHRGSSGALDKSCSKLTNNNCNLTSCCVWTSEKKCAAGGANGPTFNSDSNGKTKPLDYYYFKGKCYGDKCSK